MATTAAGRTSKATKAKYTPRQRKEQAALLDEYLALEEEAEALSKTKCAARDALLAIVDHGDIVVASDGRSRRAVDEVTSTKQHNKVVTSISRDYGVGEDELEAYYKETAGSKHVRELSKKGA